jgi:hypothetical protein
MAAPLVPKLGDYFWYYNGGAVSSPNIPAYKNQLIAWLACSQEHTYVVCLWSSYNFFKLIQAGEQTWYLFVVLFIFSNISAELRWLP